jgi:tripartite-type tricarboxylate transporter receptor subunit TctC
MDEGMATCLRDAMASAMENDELISTSEEQERELNFLSGEEVDEQVQVIMDAPPEYRELLETLY